MLFFLDSAVRLGLSALARPAWGTGLGGRRGKRRGNLGYNKGIPMHTTITYDLHVV